MGPCVRPIEAAELGQGFLAPLRTSLWGGLKRSWSAYMAWWWSCWVQRKIAHSSSVSYRSQSFLQDNISLRARLKWMLTKPRVMPVRSRPKGQDWKPQETSPTSLLTLTSTRQVRCLPLWTRPSGFHWSLEPGGLGHPTFCLFRSKNKNNSLSNLFWL